MPRKVVIAGGSGMLGQALAQHLAGRGMDVAILSRRPSGPQGPVRWRPWSALPSDRPEAWEEELQASFALINMAGRSVNCRYTAANRRAMLDSRILSTRALGQAVARCAVPPTVWINSSTATIYKHTYGVAHDEEHGRIGATPAAKDAFSIEVATAWEREFLAAARQGVRQLALRTAIVLSRRPGNVVSILRRLTRLGLGGPMGSGRQWVSWVHELDFCRAVEFLLDRQTICGIVNVASPHPLSNAMMMAGFREVCGRRFGLPAARWMLEIGAFLLRTETELLIKSRRVVPGRLVHAGFAFTFPDFPDALRNLVAPTPARHSHAALVRL